jgi:hypothetical protein
VVDDGADQVHGFQAEVPFGKLARIADPGGRIEQPYATAKLKRPFGRGEVGLCQQRQGEKK